MEAPLRKVMRSDHCRAQVAPIQRIFGLADPEAMVSLLKSAPVPEAGAGLSYKEKEALIRKLTKAGIASPAPMIGATIANMYPTGYMGLSHSSSFST